MRCACAVSSVGTVTAEGDDCSVTVHWRSPGDVSMSNITSFTVYWCLAISRRRGACAVSLRYLVHDSCHTNLRATTLTLLAIHYDPYANHGINNTKHIPLKMHCIAKYWDKIDRPKDSVLSCVHAQQTWYYFSGPTRRCKVSSKPTKIATVERQLSDRENRFYL